MGSTIFILLWGIPMLVGWLVVDTFRNPLRSLALLFLDLAAKKDREERVTSELGRKCAIADAAIVARARGETFTPPADYDR